MRAAVVLFTRDLRVHDHPALIEAVRVCERVVPLFVLDPSVLARFGAPNRSAFLLEALHDLRRGLRERGGALVIRQGDVVEETILVAREAGADAVFLSEDVSAYAIAREARLRRACLTQRLEVRAFPGVTVVPPGDVAPLDRDHYRVFTPFWRRWQTTPRRRLLAAPLVVEVPRNVARGRLPALRELATSARSPELPRGGESEARGRLRLWLRTGLRDYARLHDDLGADATSRLSPYLHFGCISPLEVAERAEATGDCADPFVRQLAWRDFFAQLLAANASTPRDDYRPRGDRWREDDDALAAWKEGRTGFPLVDAGMRQLRREGWMHNRARLVAGSFLTKHLYLDWRLGAEHFSEHLVDGDVASNVGNWQWVAGTGADTRPNRVFNPVVQSKRFDPTGDYVKRYVPELADGRDDYPEPIVDHDDAVARFRRARQASAA